MLKASALAISKLAMLSAIPWYKALSKHMSVTIIKISKTNRVTMYQVTVQNTISNMNTPSSSQLKRWAKEALKQKTKTAELNIRIVDTQEMIDLNSRYRHKTYATNVLSFPFDMPEEIE